MLAVPSSVLSLQLILWICVIALQCVARIPKLAEQLAELHHQGVSVRSFVYYIVSLCATKVGTQPIHQALLLELVPLIPLDDILPRILKLLLDRGLCANDDSVIVEAVQHVVR